MPERIEPARFPGHEVPVSVEFVSIGGRDLFKNTQVPRPGPSVVTGAPSPSLEPFKTTQLSVTNHSNKDIRMLGMKFDYLAPDGRRLGGWDKQDQWGTWRPLHPGDAKPILVAKGSQAVFETDAHFLPTGTKTIAVTVRTVGFADAETWTAAVLKNPGFGAGDASGAQAEAARAQLDQDVEDIFAQNDPFDFDFKLTDTDGKAIAMADFAGKVLIVDVWGTWCPPCLKEIPHFVALQRKFAEASLVIVGLNSERVPDQQQALKLVQDFREQNGMNYRCALVNNDTLQGIPEFVGFPTTMFFDRNGDVRAKVVGYHDYAKLEIIVRKLLDEKIDSTKAGGSSKKKARLSFGMAGFVRRSPWPVPEQGGMQGNFWASSFSPDGQTYMVFGDSGPRGIVRLWDLATGKPLHEFRTGKDVWFNNATFVPGSKQVVTAYSNDKNLYLWDVPTGKLVHEFQGHTGNGVTVYVSHDGRRLVSTAQDHSLRLWDLTKSQQVWTQDVSGEQIAGVVFSPDDRLILTSGVDRILRIRQRETGVVVEKLEAHGATCAGDFSPDGKQVLSWGQDGQIRLWDIGTAKTLQLFDGRTDAVRQAWHVEGGRQVLTWGKDSVFRVWDASTGRKLRDITVSNMIPPGWSEAVVSPDGQRLLVVNSDKADVRLVDIISGKELYRSQKGKLAKARGFAFSPDGRYVAAGSFRTGVYLVELPVSESKGALQTPSQSAESKP